MGVPGMSRGVMVTRELVLMSTGSLSLSRPVRILGPCRSCRMQMVRFSFLAARRSRAILRACSGCVPWEKFSRATSMPNCIISRIRASVLHDGPMVQIILARRVAAMASSADKSPETRSGLPGFNFSPFQCRRERPARASQIQRLRVPATDMQCVQRYRRECRRTHQVQSYKLPILNSFARAGRSRLHCRLRLSQMRVRSRSVRCPAGRVETAWH